MATVRNYTALLSGQYLNGEPSRTPVVLTYSFDTKPQAYLADAGYKAAAIKSWAPLSITDKLLAKQAIQVLAQSSGIVFIEVGAGKGDMRFGKMDFAQTHSPNASAFAYYPGRTLSDTYAYAGSVGSDVFLNTAREANLHTLMHEIGHAVGLKHPFEGVTTLAADLDNTTNTVMAYNGDRQFALGRFDVEALKFIYGSADRASGTLLNHSFKDGVVLQKWGSASNKIAGTELKDHIIGGAGNDTIAGFAGNDVLEGGSGHDRLFGGAGNDRLKPGTGNDFVYGGSQEWSSEGSDTVDYSEFSSAVKITLEMSWNGSEWVPAQATGKEIGTDKLYSIDNAEGGKGADEIAGNSNSNVLRGNGGNDYIYGHNGNDTLYGGSGGDTLQGDGGEDKLFGDSGNDFLFGGDSRDWLHGGSGRDQLTGGTGKDFFIFQAGYYKDRVMDFENNIDTIRLGRDLWSGKKTVAQVIKDFAVVKGGNAVFDFGDGDVLTVAGVTNLSSLNNDILIV